MLWLDLGLSSDSKEALGEVGADMVPVVGIADGWFGTGLGPLSRVDLQLGRSQINQVFRAFQAMCIIQMRVRRSECPLEHAVGAHTAASPESNAKRIVSSVAHFGRNERAAEITDPDDGPHGLRGGELGCDSG